MNRSSIPAISRQFILHVHGLTGRETDFHWPLRILHTLLWKYDCLDCLPMSPKPTAKITESEFMLLLLLLLLLLLYERVSRTECVWSPNQHQ